MYRLIHPGDRQELPLRMLFHPAGGGVYLKACEADSFCGLVAALLDDSAYEASQPKDRLVERIRMAHDVALVAEIEGQKLGIADHNAPSTINVSSDEAMIRTLERVGTVSLAPARLNTHYPKT